MNSMFINGQCNYNYKTKYTLQQTKNIWEIYEIFMSMTEILEYFVPTIMEEILFKIPFHSAGNIQFHCLSP